MSFFARSLEKVDSMIEKLEKTVKMPPTCFDPSDPWAGEKLFKSEHVYKVRCTTEGCDYLLTKPFETHCPKCYFRGPVVEAQFELKPVIGKKDGSAASKPAAPTAAAAAAATAPTTTMQPSDFAQISFKVGRIVECVRHPDSVKLYVTKIDFGGEVRQVVTGLVPYYADASMLTGRLVVAVVNLKAVKLAKTDSQAMILTADWGADTAKTVRLLEPPAGSQPGDRVFLQGGAPPAAEPKTMSSAFWASAVAALQCKGNVATFADVPLVTARGPIGAAGAPDGASIH